MAAAGTIYFLAGGLEVLAWAPSTLVLPRLAMVPAQLVVQYWNAAVNPIGRSSSCAFQDIPHLLPAHRLGEPKLRRD